MRPLFLTLAASSVLLGCLIQSAPAQIATSPNTLGTTNLAAVRIADPIIPTQGWTRLNIIVQATDTAPKIDGRLDDPCWKTATHADGFYRLSNTTPVAQQTEAWICADKKRLYVAFHCIDSQPGLIHASETQRDGNVDQDDYVGIDIDSQNSHRSSSTFRVTPRGCQAEYLEGGTAANITWAGDWKAATRRADDGWTAEFAIPFALLRYPQGTQSFGIHVFRKMARETFLTGWPFIPQTQVQNEHEYYADFKGISPPFYAPRPIILPYTLATAGAGSAVREGMDIKYPISTTMTGVATIFPDFQTIEQNVTDVNFSYTEKLLTDNRPFFAEGSQFMPYNDLFYSRRIGNVDEGLKVVGKQGDTTVGFLSTATHGQDSQSDAVLSVGKEIGLLSSMAFNFVTDQQARQPANQTAKFEGIYGWQQASTRYDLQADHIPSWQAGRATDSKDYFKFENNPLPGHISFVVDYTDIGPNFVSNLGYVPEEDVKGDNFLIKQDNRFDKGPIERYEVGLPIDSYQHHTGGFFHSRFAPYFQLSTRSGWFMMFGNQIMRRDQFHDFTQDLFLNWGGKTLFQGGGLVWSTGHLTGQDYLYLNVQQGILISRPFSCNINWNQLHLGATNTTQTVITGTYRLNPEQALGCRMVKQDSQTNLYLSFGQKARSGSDLFILFGDPNSPRTRGVVTVKLVHPY